ncbi:CRISPR-associated helicase Cas3' [Psychromicrobium xiongbiense]|uniref:CRISPR-associated helicase Cas3' n=1 Tax=Psychromicrobium xiongbiense TaxID=3051184 RepID=UPI002555C9E2|nr:CRISPR-associated helicase Cas3' [Psychromicrobium sp. YIM S02556]
MSLPGTTDNFSHELSDAARSVWAKSFRDPESGEVSWLPLYQHLDDAAGVASMLWSDWVPLNVRRLIVEALGGDEELAQRIYTWLVSIHDVGKASPAFAVQSEELGGDMQQAGFVMNPALRGTEERKQARHESVGYFAVRNWLVQSNGCPPQRAASVASIIAAHHGRPPSSLLLQQIEDRSWLIGDGLWLNTRNEFLERARSLHLQDGDLDQLSRVDLPETALVLLSALVIVADWIASNEQLFSYAERGEAADADTVQRLAEAWERLDALSPWQLPDPPMETDELFAARFSLPDGAKPRKLQSALIEAAKAAEEPELFILEAQMGTGKTEAALAAAEILAAKFGLGGIYLGLPTQATTNGMFSRVLEWARALEQGQPSSVFLGHGKSSLNKQYQGMLQDAFVRSITEEAAGNSPRSKDGVDDELIAHRWLTGKLGPSANIMVGTVDQGLVMALRSKYVMLRHLALAGKVVVIDECHAYDSFMNVYLSRVLHWLGAYQVPVILLSATLPTHKRQEMLIAYNDGRQRSRGIRRSVDRGKIQAAAGPDLGYPSVVRTDQQEQVRAILPEREDGAVELEIALERLVPGTESISDVLLDLLEEGGCAAVILNTVRAVQETSDHLREVLLARWPDCEIVTAHSRFLATDRASKDTLLLDMFGSPRRSTGRPHRAVVIASQVIEQSLDIDFDVMIAELAPIDLLFQRAGRLHRHRRGVGEAERPAKLRQPRLYLSGVDWNALPPEPQKSFSKVYQPYVSYRTLAVLEDRASLSLPSDIPELVQQVYGDGALGGPGWDEALTASKQNYQAHIDGQRAQAKTFCLKEVRHSAATLIGWMGADVGSVPDNKAGAAVRDIEESLEVIALFRDESEQVMTPPWWEENGGVPLPLDAPPKPWLGRAILGSTLSLPGWMCRGGRVDSLISHLERAFDFPQWAGSRELKGELAVIFDQTGRATLDSYTLSYNAERGLEVGAND